MIFNIKIAFSTSPIIGSVIREFTGGDVNHAFLIFFDPVFDAYLTLGANANGLTIESLENFSDKIVYMFKSKDPTRGLEVGLRANLDLLNKPYDFRGLFGMAAVELARKCGKDINNPFLSERQIFCSEYSKKVINDSGYEVLPDVLPGNCDPSQLCHALIDLPEQFDMVKV